MMDLLTQGIDHCSPAAPRPGMHTLWLMLWLLLASSGCPRSSGEKRAGEKCTGEKCTGEKCTGEKCTGEKCTGEKCTGEKCTGEKCTGEKCTGEKCAGENPVHITDDLGRSVVLRRPATRIASISPSNTEILFRLGCGDRIVLRDRASTFPPEALRLPATSAFQLSPEHLAGFSPEIVLFSHLDAGRLRALQVVGLPVATFDPRTIDQVFSNIRSIGALCGQEPAATRLISRLRRRVERVVESVRALPRPRVYIETDGTDPLRPWTAGRGSLVDHLLQLAGGRNLAEDLQRPIAQLNVEAILGGRPDVILLMNVESEPGRGLARLRARPGWAALEAVRQGRIVDSIHADLLSRPGPRLVDGLEALARAIHPGTPLR
jgi:iron complex transport system substrate-binding protein